MHGTVWDWSYYPNDTISTDGGMEWLPDYEGPGFVGAWKMKKRAGGNSESNFSGTAPGSIDNNKDYTVSVWCKTSNHSMARIHINTTKDGSSYWGYASGYHSGNGSWERLSVIIPANAGNTSINTIRCQCLGTSTNADAYWRDYQVEQRDHPTPFILGGTRSVSGSLIDLTRTFDLDLSNVSFDSNAQMTFDGTDDYLEVPSLFVPTGSRTVEVIVNIDTVDNGSGLKLIFNNSDQPGNGTDDKGIAILYRYGSFQGYIYEWNGSTSPRLAKTFVSNPETNKYYHLTITHDNTTAKFYCNGKLITSGSCIGSRQPSNDTTIGRYSPGYGVGFNGDIPLVRVYNKTLTSNELEQNYNALKSRFELS